MLLLQQLCTVCTPMSEPASHNIHGRTREAGISIQWLLPTTIANYQNPAAFYSIGERGCILQTAKQQVPTIH